jgi:hypothetical protein
LNEWHFEIQIAASDSPQFQSYALRFQAVLQFEFCKQMLHVLGDGAPTDSQYRSHFRPRLALRNPKEDFGFAWRQAQ